MTHPSVPNGDGSALGFVRKSRHPDSKDFLQHCRFVNIHTNRRRRYIIMWQRCIPGHPSASYGNGSDLGFCQTSARHHDLVELFGLAARHCSALPFCEHPEKKDVTIYYRVLLPLETHLDLLLHTFRTYSTSRQPPKRPTVSRPWIETRATHRNELLVHTASSILPNFSWIFHCKLERVFEEHIFREATSSFRMRRRRCRGWLKESVVSFTWSHRRSIDKQSSHYHHCPPPRRNWAEKKDPKG